MTTVNFKHFCTELEIPEISKLESISSQEILIHGIPWKISIRKEGQDAEHSLSAHLFCSNTDKSQNWSLWGAVSFKLLPFSDDTYPIEHHTEPHVFDASGIGHGICSFIKWNDLLNPDKKYIKDDTINLKVEVTAENPNDPNRSGLNFECVQKCCNNCHFSEFRLTVTNILNLMAVRSPEFTLCGLPWEVQVSKMRSSNLGVLLRLRKDPGNVSSKTAMTIKLVSSKKDVQSIEKCVTKEHKFLKNVTTLGVVSWDKVIKPENGFVNDNSITLQISIGPAESDASGEPITKRAKLNPENEAKSPQMECPICLKCIANQDLAVTTCGHMFCFECIKNSIKTRAACPSCNEAIRLNGLRQIYLPGVN